MGYIRLRRWPLWSAGASEARPRFGSLGAAFRPRQSAVAAALCRRTPKGPRVAYPADSSVSRGHAGSGDPAHNAVGRVPSRGGPYDALYIREQTLIASP